MHQNEGRNRLTSEQSAKEFELTPANDVWSARERASSNGVRCGQHGAIGMESKRATVCGSRGNIPASADAITAVFWSEQRILTTNEIEQARGHI